MNPFPGERVERHAGFSLLEAVVSVMVFGLLMLAVGMLWSTTWRASERIAAGGDGDAGGRLVLRRLAEAFEHSLFRPGAAGLYAWQGEDDVAGTEESDRVSFVSSLAPDSPEGEPSLAPLERVKLAVEDGPGGGRRLVMSVGPLTMEANDWQRRRVLLEDVSSFRLRYWSADRKDWVDGWREEGRAPRAVQVLLARKGGRADPARGAWPLGAVARIHAPPVAEAANSSTNAPAPTP